MKPRVTQEINRLAAEVGADGWTLVRENKHLVIDFKFGDRVVRQVVAATPASGSRGRMNEAAWLKRKSTE